MVTFLAIVITAVLFYIAYKWCKKHPCDEGFSD